MAQPTRPKIISVISVITIVLILLAFPLLFMPNVKHMGDFVPMVLGIIITLQFVSVIGIWHMKQWGVILFIIMFSVRVLTFMYLDMLGFRFYFNVLYSIICIVIFLRHVARMDTNL